MSNKRIAGPEIERLIQLLAKVPGLGPRSARRAALHLIKKKEQLLAPLAGAISAEPRLKLVVLNCYPQLPVERLRPLSAAGQVFFDLSMVERVGGISRLAEHVSGARVLFGSHYPFFYFESALLKVQEAGLSTTGTELLAGNARRLLDG